MDPNIANFSITIPFPGTKLYQDIKKRGKFLINMDKGINAGFYTKKTFYSLPGMDSQEILKYHKQALRSFYFRPKKILELLFGLKSVSEFKWLLNTSLSVIKNVGV